MLGRELELPKNLRSQRKAKKKPPRYAFVFFIIGKKT